MKLVDAANASDAGGLSTEKLATAPVPSDAPPVATAATAVPPRMPTCNPADKQGEVTDILQRIQVLRKRRLFVLISESIDDSVCSQVYSWKAEHRAAGESDDLDILIHSPGGELTACYRVARLFARYTNSWEALVPHLAASGATLISLGSSNVVLSEIGQLGPIDPQVLSRQTQKFFATERQSPVEAFQAVRYLREQALVSLDAGMRFLTQRMVAPRPSLETSARLAVDLARPILEKIDPYDLGAFSLDSNLAINYCRRVATPSDSNKKTQRNVNFKLLVENYPAHEFVIDIEEARSLGFSVCSPEDQLDVLFNELRPHLEELREYVGLVPAADEKGKTS